MAPEMDVSVIIVGGGIVGLSASLFLSYHGLSSIVVERHSGSSIHPRARSVNARSMELFRHLGIDELVHEAGASMVPTRGMHAGHSVREILENKKRSKGERSFPVGPLGSISPGTGKFVTQDLVEPVLIDAAKNRGVDLRFYTECLGIAQTGEHVTATLKDRKTGAVSTVKGSYLIAADGAKSPIRNQLNISTSGRGTMGHLVNVLFYADLKSFVQGREFSICIIERPEMFGLLTSINNSDKWVIHIAYDPEKGERPEDFTKEKCKELIRLALGMPEIELYVKSVLPWEAAVNVTESMQKGRVFIAGDAAHQMPPWAGQGANSGVADVHNLAWKISQVLKGNADEALLHTYEAERLPVTRKAAEISVLGTDRRGVLSINWNLDVANALFQKMFIISGHSCGYASKSISPEDLSPLGGLTWTSWTVPGLFLAIDGRPGRRLPHLWIERDGQRVSTLDLCGKSFVLLAGANGSRWVHASKSVSLRLNVDVAAYCIGPDCDITAPKGGFEAATGISATGAVLVRPDDFVAWRARRASKDPEAQLEQAMKLALCLE